jgi:hypothetical protein
MSDDELKLTRRLFLQHSATAAAFYSIALKTDAVARAQQDVPQFTSDGPSPYPYSEPPG